jgi:hypothetical protein
VCIGKRYHVLTCGDPSVVECSEVSRYALRVGGYIRGVYDHSVSSIPLVDQVRNCLVGAVFVVYYDRIDSTAFYIAVHQNPGCTFPNQFLQIGSRVAGGRDDDQSIHALLLKCADHCPLTLQVFIGVVQDQGLSILPDDFLNGAGQLSKGRIGDIGDHQADGMSRFFTMLRAVAFGL